MTSLQPEKCSTLVHISRDFRLMLGHMGNIFSAKFMPHTNNTKIISCAGDRLIKLSEVEYTPERTARGSTKRTWYCHSDMTKRIVTEDNPNTFLSCSEDGNSLCTISDDRRRTTPRSSELSFLSNDTTKLSGSTNLIQTLSHRTYNFDYGKGESNVPPRRRLSSPRVPA
jgi:hypothetical protein